MPTWTYALADLPAVASDLATTYDHLPVWLLRGEMGSGKTTLVRALCAHWRVQDEPSSPTFSIINQYLTFRNEVLYHIDLYRLKDAAEARDAGVADCLDSGRRCLVEWPSVAPELFELPLVLLDLQPRGANQRTLTADVHE